MSCISKSQVLRLRAEIDERVGAFLGRPLEGDWPYLWIDAAYVKVRQAGRIVSAPVTIAVAVITDRRGSGAGSTSSATPWSTLARGSGRWCRR